MPPHEREAVCSESIIMTIYRTCNVQQYGRTDMSWGLQESVWSAEVLLDLEWIQTNTLVQAVLSL